MRTLNKKITNINFQKNLKKIYSKNKPFKYIVIDDFLTKNVANEFEKSFKINSEWTNYSLVNNFKKFGLKKRNLFSNEMVICMGAGSISSWIREIGNKLK